MREATKITLASAIFCNSTSHVEGGRLDCRGVFTSFLAFGYPTSVRTWHAVLTIYDLPAGTSNISVSIARGKGKKTVVGSADAKRGKVDVGNVLDIPLRYQFDREGMYIVHFNVVGTTKVLRVPVNVITQKWPRFTSKQRDFVKKNPEVPSSMLARVACPDCSSPYMFEESVLPSEKMAEGIRRFPKSGVFDCVSCGHQIDMKDIQGQMRNSIKAAVSSAMRGGH